MPVEFNDEQQQRQAALMYSQLQSGNRASGIEQWLITKGIVSTEVQARKVILSITAVALLLSAFLFYRVARNPTEEITPAGEQRLNSMLQELQTYK